MANSYGIISPSETNSYMASFPDTVYDLSETSHLVRFVDALCGEAGIGGIRKREMLKRVQTSLSQTAYLDLDELYSAVFGIRRLRSEMYPYRASDLLTFAERQEMEVKDAHYRSRIAKYMESFQHGGTREGIRLAAEAALGVPCEVVTGQEYYSTRGIADGTPLGTGIGVRPVDRLWHAPYVTFGVNEMTIDDPHATFALVPAIDGDTGEGLTGRALPPSVNAFPYDDVMWTTGDLTAVRSGVELQLGWKEKSADYNEYVVVADALGGDQVGKRFKLLQRDLYLSDGRAWRTGDDGGTLWWEPSALFDVSVRRRALWVDLSDTGEAQLVDGAVTVGDDQVRSFYDLTRRVRPVDARVTLRLKGDLADELHVEGVDELRAPMGGVEASSTWWQVVKRVTGRMDWDYVRHPSTWVEPGVAKEAPRQPLVWTEEDYEDFTPVISSVSASTEHHGLYGAEQQRFFPSLRGVDGDQRASFAVSMAASDDITSSYYGGALVTGFSYPVEYAAERRSQWSEVARSERWWSSEEHAPGVDEWLEVGFERTVPVNRVRLDVCRKPLEVRLLASSWTGSDGERAWTQVRTADGFDVAFESRDWGGPSVSGDMLRLDLSFPTIQASALRLEFRRLDVPYRCSDAAGNESLVYMEYSVEVADLSVRYDVRYRDDFVPSQYPDAYGNLVTLGLREFPASAVADGDDSTFWVSQPNVAPDAVEWLVVDTRADDGSASAIDYVQAYPIFGGCQMNLYSTEDDEPGNWRPYPRSYTLSHERIRLPLRKAKWVKAEFTDLAAIPYTMLFDDVRVRSLVFPYEVREHFRKRDDQTFEQSRSSKLLGLAGASDWGASAALADMGGRVSGDASGRGLSGYSTGMSDDFGYADFMPVGQYSDSSRSPVGSAYGDGMLVEDGDSIPSVNDGTIDMMRPRCRFWEEGPHRYDVDERTRTANIAYVVGIRSLSFGYDEDMWLLQPNETAMVPLGDARMVADSNGWALDPNGETFRPVGDGSLGWVETRDVTSAVPFRSLDLAVSQRPTEQRLEHPSDMFLEWSGKNAETSRDEFGTSGTVLAAALHSGESGVVSEPVPVMARSIGQFQVDVFPAVAGRWHVRCVDAHGGEVFSMRYDVPARRWSTLGTVFNPVPSGGWWDESYRYRVRIPIEGPLTRGDDVMVACVDLGFLRDKGALRQDMADLRLVYADGAEAREVDMDVTGDRELWFDVQQDLASGEAADGTWHADRREFAGAYYLYFGNRDEKRAPRRNWRKLYEMRSAEVSDAASLDSAGVRCDSAQAYAELPYRLPSLSGFVSLDYTPTSSPQLVGNGGSGVVRERVLLDYQDGDKRIVIRLWGTQLMVEIADSAQGGFVSGYASRPLPELRANRTVTFAVSWGEPGSASVREHSFEGGEHVRGGLAGSPLRRKIEVAMGVDGRCLRLPSIQNVYGEDRFEDDSDPDTEGSF